jgi:beta-phosphoglucomutase-like phosphatase (HAD superfamily)
LYNRLWSNGFSESVFTKFISNVIEAIVIQAMIFDLDGTLVQTEKLKALSYANAVQELCPFEVTEGQVLDAYKDVVGLPRRQVAKGLAQRFELEQAAELRQDEFGVSSAWQVLIQLRFEYYDAMLANSELILANRWPYNLEILKLAREQQCKTGLATMSRCKQASQVITILDLEESFNFIATRDDVERGKPDPEIYNLMAGELNVQPKDCLVLEDSPSGVRAAIAAGMHCIAVTTPFTSESVPALGLLPEQWIINDPSLVLPAVERILNEQRG